LRLEPSVTELALIVGVPGGERFEELRLAERRVVDLFREERLLGDFRRERLGDLRVEEERRGIFCCI
jgi:hypothetical protein